MNLPDRTRGAEGDMRTRDLMTSPVVTVTLGAHLKDVAATLVENGVNAVPVVDERGRLAGIVSEADLLRADAPPGDRARFGSPPTRKGLPPRTAREVMTQAVYTTTVDADAAAAARLMLRHGLKSVPVLDGDRVVGILARRDLLRLVARSDRDIRADLERRLKEELSSLQRLAIDVADGVVTFSGPAGALARELPEVLARMVPGVTEVRWEPTEG
jgi:CBS domain-containing protein